MNCYNIGIIGGGVSGLSVLYQIVQQAKKDDNMGRQFTVHMFDALSSFGCGAAWSHNNTDVQLFNFPAGVASYVYRDFSGPFVRWCKTHNHEDVEYFSYPPRYLLGDYAEDFLKVGSCAVKLWLYQLWYIVIVFVYFILVYRYLIFIHSSYGARS